MKKSTFILIALMLATIIVTSCKDNSPVGKVIEAHRNGEISSDSLFTFLGDTTNRAEVLEWAKKHKGDKEYADCILAGAYQSGENGFEQNPTLAKSLFLGAAKNGFVSGMAAIGEFYVNQPGMENPDSAKYWFEKAAAKGDGRCYFYLGKLSEQLSMNRGLPLDTTYIIGMYRKGMELHDAPSTTQIALDYANGVTVKKDTKKAFELLYNFPYSKLDPEGHFVLGQMYETGEGVAANFNEALKFYKLSAAKGNTNANCKIGNFYQNGQGVPQNPGLAFKEYEKAANAGNPWGMRCVAYCYMNGFGTSYNVDTAWYWYINAARNGDVDSQMFCMQRGVNYQ